VCFTVVGKTNVLPSEFSTEFESVIAFGRAIIVEGEEKKDALLALVDKYSPEFKVEGIQYIDRAIAATFIIKIQIDKVTGKARR
jgi:nitroimidazol reductase NimA-like FMN-containing flavoprotein (pyridoxamine 5'-phosphate oxidase superfamily)